MGQNNILHETDAYLQVQFCVFALGCYGSKQDDILWEKNAPLLCTPPVLSSSSAAKPYL